MYWRTFKTILQAGVGSHEAHGSLILTGATVDHVVTVTNTEVTINPSVVLVTGEINAQSYDINTTGAVIASNVESATVVASESFTTPLLLSAADAINLGDDDSFLLTRPNHTSGSASSLVIEGQAGASCILTGNNYSAATCPGGDASSIDGQIGT